MDQDNVFGLSDNPAYASIKVTSKRNSKTMPAAVIHKKPPPIKNSSNKSRIIVLVILVMGLNFLLALSGVVIGIFAFLQSARLSMEQATPSSLSSAAELSSTETHRTVAAVVEDLRNHSRALSIINAKIREINVTGQHLTGPQGADGSPGPRGPRGDKGATGQPGSSAPAHAPIGYPAERGPPGDKGDRGFRGSTGPVGVPGVDGFPGQRGAPGGTGDTGRPGSSGPVGLPGLIGDQGERGFPGDKGDKGDKGSYGPGLRCRRSVPIDREKGAQESDGGGGGVPTKGSEPLLCY